jgi:hypothetical protein
MSRFDAFVKGWSFRTNRPDFEPGTEITAFITGRQNGSYIARIGDTVLRVEETDTDADGDVDDNADSDVDADTAPVAGNGDDRGRKAESGQRSPGGGRPDLVDTQVRLRVEDFDSNDHTGRGTVLERLGSGGF